MTNDEQQFWDRAARQGLPWFLFLRRSIPSEVLDARFSGTRIEESWNSLKLEMQAGDKIWPFKFHMRPFLGMRSGYIVLRKGRPIGGIVTVVS